ncbi:XdhC family protein [Pseudomonas versuta]|uniref:XdhC family protein n=1 Tax=Pseudomonas versuta TaxID=1788301 RepID=UPI0037C7A59F
MDSLDLQVIQQAQHWVTAGQPVWLCTVLSTFGSAPRGPGAMLVAMASGEHRGSLSGGCVEEDFMERLCTGQFAPVNQVVRYGDGGLAPTLELPCGGVLEVLIEYLAPEPQTLEHLEILRQALTGQCVMTRGVTPGDLSRRILPGTVNGPRVQVAAHEILIRVGPVVRLLLAGLSPVAEFCASFALALGYEVVVCDPRPQVLEGFALPGVHVHPRLPSVFIEEGGCHAATAVVALTHDPRLDDLTLMEAVRTEAFYIGAMGSQRTSDKRIERLARIGGLDARALARIHAPIGLRLGSKTPAEIALAVMADILRVSNGIGRRDV